jgi:peptide/nickel transport system permease protein
MSSTTFDLIEGGRSAPLEPLTGAEIAARSPLELFWRRLRRDKVALVSLAFIVLLVVVAIAAPLVVKLVGAPGPDVQDPNALTQYGTPTGPSAQHIFGVDPLGRDIFSRVIYGARPSLEVAFIATGLSMLIGIAIGMMAGFYRGPVDTLLSRMIDITLAFPVLLLGLGLGAACAQGNGCLGGAIKPGVDVVIVVIVIGTWTYIARIVRGQVLSLREKEFVEAARSLGASEARIIFREVLPNLTASIIVVATLFIPINILFEAALSYLGVGVQPPNPSWGGMLADATNIFNSAWWYMVFPGAALLLTVLAFNLVGDGLQDALRPRAAHT